LFQQVLFQLEMRPWQLSIITMSSAARRRDVSLLVRSVLASIVFALAVYGAAISPGATPGDFMSMVAFP